VKVLLDAGTDINQANETGEHAAACGRSTGTFAVIQLLVDRGANIDAQNKAGMTPLALTLPRPRQPGGPPSNRTVQQPGAIRFESRGLRSKFFVVVLRSEFFVAVLSPDPKITQAARRWSIWA